MNIEYTLFGKYILNSPCQNIFLANQILGCFFAKILTGSLRVKGSLPLLTKLPINEGFPEKHSNFIVETTCLKLDSSQV